MARVLALAALCGVAVADVYMHNPPGSNDRNRERNENRNNGNRLFDSQNNDKGGYPWRGDREVQGAPDAMEYYEGSDVVVEWTAQHACGDNPSTLCTVVIQLGCEDNLPQARDGYPTGNLNDADNNNGDYNPAYQKATFDDNNGDGTNQVNANNANNVEYGLMEGVDLYQDDCAGRSRNQGLYTADQNLNNDDATSTRQNPNGDRSGFECPEERDYYPYWAPSPYRDLAVMVSNTSWCDYYQAQSQNVVGKMYCNNFGGNGDTPIEQAACTAGGGQWVERAADGIPPPSCTLSPTSRQNHLGNTDGTIPDPNDPSTILTEELGGGEAAHVVWKVPKLESLTASSGRKLQAGQGMMCFTRLRYNISTTDYDSMAGFIEGVEEDILDADNNCDENDNNDNNNGDQAGCNNALTDNNRPLYNRPYVQAFDDGDPKVSIALNTDQSGRTFQDRSHMFEIVPRPAGLAESAAIWNVNTRGRRGNIVQSYPSVEYGFFPAEMTVAQGDLLHFQFHSSDFNTDRNPNNADGWQYSDRTNLIQVEDQAVGIPLEYDTSDELDFFGSKTAAREFALLDSEAVLAQSGAQCEEFNNGDDNEQNDPRNCGKLNAASARFVPSVATMRRRMQATDTEDGDTGLVEVNHDRGEYNFVGTRNNNFSNRSNKWLIRVGGLKWWEGILVFFVVVAVACAAVFFAKTYLATKNMSLMEGCATYCCCCLHLDPKSSKKKKKSSKGNSKKSKGKSKGSSKGSKKGSSKGSSKGSKKGSKR